MRGLVAAMVALVVTALLTGWGAPTAPASYIGHPATAQAVRAVIGGPAPPAADALPPGFAGYRPAIADGLLVRPDGSCSSPLGGTVYGFTAACAQHDVGYDLLRHADRIGDPPGGWARRALDDAFAARLDARCAAVDGGVGCAASAALYSGVVRVNTWRQGAGPPVVESWPWTAAAVFGGVLAGFFAYRGTFRGGRDGAPSAGSQPWRASRNRRLRSARGVIVAAPALGGAVAATATVLMPPLLPLPPAVRALVVGIVALHGYLLGVLVRGQQPCPQDVSRHRAGRAGAQAGFRRPAGGRPMRSVWPAGHRLGIVGAVALAAALTVPVTAAPADPGVEGRAFLAGRIARSATGGPQPVRVYIGLGGGPDAAVDALSRAGGLDRSTVLVVVPTGSGWVNQAAVAALEQRTGGDVATVAVQYAARPSWVEYLSGTDAARRSAVSVVAAVRERLDRLPHRPRLLVYGESLGAVAARAADGSADASLLVGEPGAAWGTGSVVHPDDPVGWLSPRLLVERPGGWPEPWLPVVSFWQTAGSLLVALDVPAGHGHRYGPEPARAWVVSSAVARSESLR